MLERGASGTSSVAPAAVAPWLSREQLPAVHEIVERLTRKAGMPMPRIYVIPSETPNAFATGRNPSHSAVAVTQGILRILNARQLEGVLAHERRDELDVHVDRGETSVATVRSAHGGHHDRVEEARDRATVDDAGRLVQRVAKRQTHAAIVDTHVVDDEAEEVHEQRGLGGAPEARPTFEHLRLQRGELFRPAHATLAWPWRSSATAAAPSWMTR